MLLKLVMMEGADSSNEGEMYIPSFEIRKEWKTLSLEDIRMEIKWKKQPLYDSSWKQ